MKTLSAFFRPALPAWAAPLCGVTGAALLLSGIVCFFAYNWANLGLLLKLGLPLVGLLACAFGTYKKGLQSGAGQVFSVAVGLFIGIFFAVYGQVYQTGAFVYEFSVAWGVCLLPLAILAGNRWLWLLWVIVGNAYILSGAEMWGTELFIPFFTFNTLCFAVAEFAYIKTRRAGWYSLFFLLPALFACMLRGLGSFGMWFQICAGLIFLFAVYAYAHKRGAAQLGLCALVLGCLLSERIISELRFGGYVVTILSVMAVFVVAAWAVYMLTRQEAKHD